MKIKKTIAAIAAAAMVFSSIPMVAFADVEHVSSGDGAHELKYTANTELTDGKHTHKVECKTAECTYEVKESEECTAAEAFEVESDKHVKKCTLCEQIVDSHAADSTGDFTTANGKHKKLCGETGCTIVVVAEAGCTMVAKVDEEGHYEECSVCGDKGETTAHEAESGKYVADDTQHWQVCKIDGCTEIVGEKEDHTAVADASYKKDGTHHWKECTCGKNLLEKTAHSAAADAEWVQGTTQHWKLCVCGTAVSVANHDTNGEDEACSVCGVAKDGGSGTAPADGSDTAAEAPSAPTPAHVHSAGTTWLKDETNHWKLVCTKADCELKGQEGNITAKAAHTMVWTGTGATQTGACSVCGQEATRENPDYVAPTEPEPEPEPEPAPSTSGNTSSGSTSSVSSAASTPAVTTVVSAAQVATSTKPNVTVNAAETKVTTAMVTAFTSNKKAETLTLDYGSKVKVAIDKKDVKAAASVAKLDFSTTNKNFISTAAVKKNATLAKAEKVVQMNFTSTGKLEGVDKVTVKNRVGAKYAGQKATVYEYVNGKLVKVARVTVGGSGLVNFKIDHFGQYVIVVE